MSESMMADMRGWSGGYDLPYLHYIYRNLWGLIRNRPTTQAEIGHRDACRELRSRWESEE